MIKLNNKNITYVALADTNNSIKAPKEIWYADSANSVKLVYRRKDALIEDEDYEKYHWLTKELTNTDNEATYGNKAVIDTLVNFTDDLVIEAILNNADRVDNRGFGIITDQSNNVYVSFLSNNNGYFAAVCKNRIIYSQDDQINIAFSLSDITINGVTTSYSQETLTYNPSVAIGGVKSYTGVFYYKASGTQLNTSGIAKYGNFIFRKGNSVIMHLIPCKLLKPVPKWLDANGIRRQIGECGMIDLVSGKFYGNVNSEGTFTVENYYERKEWLQGRNGAYIDTMHPLTTIDDAMRVHAHYDGVTKNPLGNEQAICGVVEDYTDNSKIWAYIYIGADSNSNAYQRGLYRIGSYGQQVDSVNSLEFTSSIYIDGNNSVFTKNSGVSSVSSNGVTKKILGNVYLFSRNTMAQPSLAVKRYFQGDIASFQIGNSTFTELSVDMIPCTLTMDLPASMDANNISRAKGTSGMWDLISDRFYGNVANSGTFKAVNLAEGVDYEVYQWLVGDGSAYIDTNINLSETDIITTKFVALTIPLIHHLIYGDNSGSYNNTTLVLYKNSSAQFRPTSSPIYSFTYNTNTAYETIQSATSINVNGTQVWQGSSTFEASQYSCYVFATASSHISYMFDGKISKFIISDKINLIPCKLLKSIPAKYDANGIARQAGECGMYDTVNDVFYGNVASSGTFTVSDN